MPTSEKTLDPASHRRLMALAEKARERMKRVSGNRVYCHNTHELTSLLTELSGDWPIGADSDLVRHVGVSASTIKKFVQKNGHIKTSTARNLTERLVPYIISLGVRADHPTNLPRKRRAETAQGAALQSFNAGNWTFVEGLPEVRTKILFLEAQLQEIVAVVVNANAPPERRALDERDRRILIAVLETALNVLKSPLVERSILRRARKLLSEAASKAAEKQVELTLSGMATAAGVLLGDLIRHL